MIMLKTLLECLPSYRVVGDASVPITGLQYDSRKIRPGELFVALEGFAEDGHRYVPAAIQGGAPAVVVERLVEEVGVTQVIVSNGREALARLSDRFYEHPSGKLNLAAITGTNGKTTVCWQLKSIFEKAGHKTGLTGTLQYETGQRKVAAWNTTPESLDLEHFFVEMLASGFKAGIVEVSSHALALFRVAGIDFKVAVFTNLTQDHLDFHKTMADYRKAKARLFENLPATSWAVLNKDDQSFDFFCGCTRAKVLTYSMAENRGFVADLKAVNIRYHPEGVDFDLETPGGASRIGLKLIGPFNVANALAAAGGAVASGIQMEFIKSGLEALQSVPGRLQPVRFGQPFTVLIDYAHTPDALRRVLELASSQKTGRLIVVFGCGGDRDRGKRPQMGRIAELLADLAIVTSDNPRTEDPELIIKDVLSGMANTNKKRKVFVDRRDAITAAIQEARAGDWVVIAGKGHEKYQVIGKDKLTFSDCAEAEKALRARGFSG